MAWALGVHFLFQGVPKPSIHASETQHDFGDVPPAVVSYTIAIGNEGSSDLTILNIWTSCGCTSAKLTVNDVTSPVFNTDGDAAFDKGWHAIIRPGESAQLEISYDPTVTTNYYSGIRTVFVESDDPSQRVLQVQVRVHEIP